MLSRLLAAVLFSAYLLAPDADAIPKKYFGQDGPAAAQTALPNPSNARDARSRFLADLTVGGANSVAQFSFTGAANQTIPPRTTGGGTPAVRDFGPYNFPGGDGTTIPTLVQASDAATRTAPQFGAFNTSTPSTTQSNGFLYAVGYNNNDVVSGGVSLVYQPGTNTRPFGAFGIYITDVESFATIQLRLTPLGGATASNPVVTLSYTGIRNTGTIGQYPGNTNSIYVGFIDTDQSYEKITIDFRVPSGVETNESFGFDDLIVGSPQQLNAAKEQESVFQAQIVDEPGWRLLSAPLTGITVDDLALQNLVQGVPAGAGRAQQQYPDAPSNFYTAYNGGGRLDYVDADSTGRELVPGRGFWWYWYDLAINPDNDLEGGGTSESVVLDNFGLTAVGTELTGDVERAFTDNVNSASNSGQPDANPDPDLDGDGNPATGLALPADDDFYMIGNPYPLPLRVAGITVKQDTGTENVLGDCFFAWNPGNPNGLAPDDPNSALDGPGSYEILFSSVDDADTRQIEAAVWQGLMAEVANPDPVGGAITFVTEKAFTNPAYDPPFHGRTSSAAAETFVHFTLEGTTASGYQTSDRAAYVRFRDDAADGWDRYDASKPVPPVPSYALLAAMGVRNGAPKRQAVLSMPHGAASEVALAFVANESSTQTLRWTGTAVDAVLTDNLTGTSVSMRDATSYTFDTVPTNWTSRFTVAFASTVDAADAPLAGSFVGLPSPNPSAGAARLDVRLDASAEATVSVYDVLGRRLSVATAAFAAGVPQSVALPTAGLAPGAYVIRVEAPGVRETRRLTVIR